MQCGPRPASSACFEVALREATHKAESANREILDLNATLEQQVLERTTALETARNELLKSNARFAIAADSAGIGIWEFDVVRNSLTWDDWIIAFTGRRAVPTLNRTRSGQTVCTPTTVCDAKRRSWPRYGVKANSTPNFASFDRTARSGM